MTNTEAITKLTNIMHDDHYAWHPSILTAFGMAVDALKGAEGDWISRADAIDAIFSEPLYETGMKKRYADAVVPAIYEKIKALPSAQADHATCYLDSPCEYQNSKIALPSAQPEQRWIPIKVRPMDAEERKEWSEKIGYDLDDEEAVMFDCPMPDDGQEVWVCSKCGNVWQDTCQIDEGIYLEENGDWLDIVAWMPFNRPEPWKEGEA